jgi:hypothetical protein
MVAGHGPCYFGCIKRTAQNETSRGRQEKRLMAGEAVASLLLSNFMFEGEKKRAVIKVLTNFKSFFSPLVRCFFMIV